MNTVNVGCSKDFPSLLQHKENVHEANFMNCFRKIQDEPLCPEAELEENGRLRVGAV